MQNLIDVLPHNVRHLREVLVEPVQSLGRGRVAVLVLFLGDLAVELDEVVRLLDRLDVGPVVHRARAELALKLLLEKFLDFLDKRKSKILRVGFVEQCHVADAVLHFQVEDKSPRDVYGAPLGHGVDLFEELLRLALELRGDLVGIVPSLD
eukprot:CAMPEP_0117492188 /NCGR_PEP_ID=MMETSP0784-20121206/18452_1 /TAXON_ID=39447 /ORGANISM="" /LENGTH=150 /DNA_ID=CAMNT_0005286999 /DNA_START=253 /DNA_END=705 /DNA_ORIENTATION=+